MAHPEHLKKLQEGVTAWNEWRKDNSDIRPDLRSADLEDADLSGADLEDADLSDADLEDANLSSADLEVANLSRANLINANLSSTNLRDADLQMAQALNTNFEGANLTGAYIEDWNINSKTNLENVQCDYFFLNRTYLEEEERWVKSDHAVPRLRRDRIPHDSDKIFAPGEFTKREFDDYKINLRR